MRKMSENAMRVADGGAWYNVTCTGSRHGYMNYQTWCETWAKAVFQDHRSHTGVNGKRGYYCILFKNGKQIAGGWKY